MAGVCLLSSRKFKHFLASDDGVAAVEFAMVAPVLIFMMFGIIETGLVYAADITLKNATYEAARTGRTGFIPDGSTQDETVKQKILAQAGVLMDPSKITITSLSYKDFSNLKKPEPFVDKNGNGIRDDGENYTDVNGNGKYDTDQGASGYGGTAQVVMYTATYPWTFRTPFIGRAFSKDGTIELSATAVVQNEPY